MDPDTRDFLEWVIICGGAVALALISCLTYTSTKPGVVFDLMTYIP